MSGHTPGPWIIECGHIQRDSGGIRYWQVSDGQDAIACNQFCYADNPEANARLIAAAPTLLTALERLLGEVEEVSLRNGWAGRGGRDAARTAIELAKTGGAA